MRKLAQRGKQNPQLRDFASQLVAEIPGKKWFAEIRAIFNFVRGNIRYQLDPHDLETISAPDVTLALGYGDCDDMCVLTATLLLCLGHPSRFVALGFQPQREFEHVIVQTSGGGEDEWLALDTTEDQPLGWFPPDVRWTMIADI